jgi:poly-beta-hydroxybutyrate-responsive repressor
MERFLEPCLLLLLRRGPSHGYGLIQDLRDFGLAEKETDPGSVYRYLRRMEDSGLITSEWQTQETGPAKRTYRLTSEGEKILASWVQVIAGNKERMERFLALYRKQTRQIKEQKVDQGVLFFRDVEEET